MKTVQIKALNPRNPDTKYVGDEPQWKTQPIEDRMTALSKAFNWYNYFYSKKDAKEFVANYLDRRDQSKEAKKIRSVPDSQFRLTTGWLCRMCDMGLELLTNEQNKLNQMIQQLLEHQDQKTEEFVDKPDLPKTTIQDRLREKVTECMGELDGMFDEFVQSGAKLSANFKPVSLIRSMNISPAMISQVKDFWNSRLDEFEQAVQGKDAQLVEGYGNLTKNQLKSCVKFCELVVTDCGAYVQIKKVERKPRKVKPVSAEKRAAKFKHLIEFGDLKLKGLPAASLVDKAEAWLYDVKKRKLIHLVADEYAKSFTVKNNSVIGFSTTETQQKTLRKPGDVLKVLVAAGKPAARKLFKDIKATETVWNARGNENLVIVKAW